MKFAKELDQELVPEWRIKYLNYKAGKKYIKSVSRAIHRASGSPAVRRSGTLPPHATPSYLNQGTPYSRQAGRTAPSTHEDVDRPDARPLSRAGPAASSHSLPIAIYSERQSLADAGSDAQYGSFVPTPPSGSPPDALGARRASTFALPAPAIRVPSHNSFTEPNNEARPGLNLRSSLGRGLISRSVSMAAAPTTKASSHSSPNPPNDAAGRGSESGGATPQQRLRRLFSAASPLDRVRYEMAPTPLDEVRERERLFFEFLDSELDKIETFYHQKEQQAGDRLVLLREQLHEMRNRRTEEIRLARAKEHDQDDHHGPENGENGILSPIKAKLFRPGPNSRALQKMPYTPNMMGQAAEERRDYERRPIEHGVPYRTAKRKLKLAMQEFYRGLELLKSYALLNRKAFRKLNKKYDKAVNARPPLRYVTQKVNKAWFVNSDVLDGHIRAVEDLYARYFERGNHKVAVGKLRRLTRRPGDESGSAFRSGLLIGTGLVFCFQGIVYGARSLTHPHDPEIRLQTKYLLQLYGGYFLMLYLFAFFVIDCRIWSRNKINYQFIFEFEPQSQLDWRQLSELPSFFLLLLGVILWLDFSKLGGHDMFLYYPVVLIGITALALFLPAPILWHKSRRWFAYSHWRLLLSGLYPVEFRDFFLGDIYCSLTYATCNIELFFCLYANSWNDPPQCNSNHSRLLGFFLALPPIWRALQCLRRYRDTRNAFPHLANCAKYTMTICAAVCLSLYRLNETHQNLALFITFSTINSLYCSIWDLFMDFSLLQPDSQHRYLRDILALKRRWVYYAVMVLDPILRFAWIFYAIYTHDTQHSTIAAFLISFAEVTRRGIWTIFRVENEHCANVAQYKASRDIPLPYPLKSAAAQSSTSTQTPGDDRTPAKALSSGAPPDDGPQAAPSVTGHDVLPPSGTVRRRPRPSAGGGRKTFATIMAEAHKQDFEKKRKPDEDATGHDVPADGIGDMLEDDSASSDESDAGDAGSFVQQEGGRRVQGAENA